MNNYSLEDLEPDLVNFKSEAIDVDRMTLYNENIPLILTGLTLKNYRSYKEFYICRGCGKVYWQGTHWQRRLDRDIISKENNLKQGDDDDSSDDGIIFYDAESTM
jgi:hypothetical protein